MNTSRFNDRSAERYRLAAFMLFFLSIGVFLGGLIPAMFYGSLIGVLASLAGAGLLFGAAFILGGIGWSRLEEPSVSTFPADTEVPPPEYLGEPYSPPRPSDQDRPQQ